MTRPTPLSQIVADDLLIDRVAGREPAGDDPIASLLAALAEHADRPLGRAPTGRRFRRHRVLSALAALTVGASGAGVAAAATVPDGTPSAAPALVTRAPHRPASGPGAELVRDASGRVLVVGADGTRFDSAWLPDGVSPVLFTPAGVLGRASGAEASRFRWAALPGSTALLRAGPKQGLEGPDLEPADATLTDEAQQDAATGPIDDAATPVDPAAAPVEQPAPEPNGATTSAATPSDDATTATTPSDDATSATTPTDDATDQSDATPSGPETTGPTDAGKPADTGKPAEQALARQAPLRRRAGSWPPLRHGRRRQPAAAGPTGAWRPSNRRSDRNTPAELGSSRRRWSRGRTHESDHGAAADRPCGRAGGPLLGLRPRFGTDGPPRRLP